MNYRWVILSLIFGCQFVLSIAAFGWGPLAPFLRRVFSLDPTEIGMISSSFSFAAMLFVFPAGIMVDRFGVKNSLLLWLGLTAFPLGLSSYIHDSYALFLVMVSLAGLGYSIGNPVASKGLFIWFDKKIRGTVFGIRQSAVTGAAALGGIMLVYLSQRSGPFVALRVVSLMIVIMIVLTFFFYRDPREGEELLPGRQPKGEIGMGLVSGTLLSNRALLMVSMFTGLQGLAQGVVSTFFIVYIHDKLEYALLTAGYLFGALMISGALGRILWGVLSDLLFDSDRRPVLIIISTTTVMSLILLGVWTNRWPHSLFLPVVFGLGVSSWGWNGITFALVAEISDRTKTATSVGLATAFGWFGIALGPVCFGRVTESFGYLSAWLSLALFCSLSLILCFSMSRLGHGS